MWGLLRMQILRPHAGLAEAETLGGGGGSTPFRQPAGGPDARWSSRPGLLRGAGGREARAQSREPPE